MSEGRYDVVTLGETMIRLTPSSMERIETARHFEIHVGGSESNTAVGLARLGLKIDWLSRLTDNSLGRMIANTLSGFGVDTTHVVWTPEDRVGTYYYEPAVPPRSSRVIYDRAHSAFSRMCASDLPSALFHPQGARLLHLTGITLAVGALDVAAHALHRAQQAGWKLSFDVNYRAKLWSPQSALAACDPLMAAAEILLISLNDVRVLFPGVTDRDAAFSLLAERYPKPLIVLTMGAAGAALRMPGGDIFEQGIFPSHEIGRLGRGDAFTAGFLFGFLRSSGEDVQGALRWGAACAALKSSIPGDLPLFDLAEAQALVEQGSASLRLQR